MSTHSINMNGPSTSQNQNPSDPEIQRIEWLRGADDGADEVGTERQEPGGTRAVRSFE